MSPYYISSVKVEGNLIEVVIRSGADEDYCETLKLSAYDFYLMVKE